ncbi:hydroxymethylglutaryl-CoA synthase [Streptomyces sp. NPDC046909]|uniref:zinc ribbon domain-containing protein n=1 Tax=Streptomyces sp. NPDC046909 TaxID=3155617 RepID=UPI0033D0A2ED
MTTSATAHQASVQEATGRMKVLGYASYLPAWRLGPARTVAAFDEDSTTMAVEAGRQLAGGRPAALWLATTSPAYMDKTNATAVHAALSLPPDIPASDLIGTARSTMAGFRAAAQTGGLLLAADVRVGRPGSADEKGGADGAGAVLLGEPTQETPAIAEVLSHIGVTEEFLDRWREPARTTGRHWEERFGFERYAALVRAAATAALDAAGLSEADHTVVTSPNTGVLKRAGTLVKGRIAGHRPPVGFAGAADPLLALADVLDRAGPGETVLLLSAVDGCDALVLRTTDALVDRRQARSVQQQLQGGREVDYTRYLSWRGLVEVEPPRRPEPQPPAAPPSGRTTGWKFGLTGSRCTLCGFVHLPPARVCRGCASVDTMEPLPAADLRGRVRTHTVDRLAYSPSPPMVEVVVDLGGPGGGRSTFEVADADMDTIGVGASVGLVFRRLFTAGGVHNYFWKAHVQAEQQQEAS